MSKFWAHETVVFPHARAISSHWAIIVIVSIKGRFGFGSWQFQVDMNDNELSILELIHLFVEVLDGYFGNVCELDLVFHFDKVHGCSLVFSPPQLQYALLEIVNGLAIQVIRCDASLMSLFSWCFGCLQEYEIFVLRSTIPGLQNIGWAPAGWRGVRNLSK